MEERSARDVVTRFIDSLGFRDTSGVVPFVRQWPDIVGRDQAAHSRVADIHNGALLIEVDHPAWLQRLHFDRERIVARINARFPKLGVRNLHFRVVAALDPRARAGTTIAGTSPATGSAGTEIVEARGTRGANAGGTAAPRRGSSAPDSAAVLNRITDADFRAQLERLKQALDEADDPVNRSAD